MAGSPKLLGQAVLTGSSTSLIAVPSSKRWTVSMLHVTNIDTVQRTFTLNHVQSGGSVGNTNYLALASALPAGDFAELFGGAVMAAGDAIYGLCDSANKVCISLYGIEESV